MNFNEFNKYKNNLLSPMSVNDDGTVNNDNNHKFFLSYPDEDKIKEKDTIIAKTVAEAIYRVCTMILMSAMPGQNECLTADNDKESHDKMENTLKKLQDFSCFEIMSVMSGNLKTIDIDIKFTLNGDEKIFNITSDDVFSDNLIKTEIEDNMIVTYSTLKDNKNTTICTICSNGLAINNPFGIKLSIQERYNFLATFLMQSYQYMNYSIGFASLADNDEVNKEFTPAKQREIGFTVSRKRALMDKIDKDKKQIRHLIAYSDHYIKDLIKEKTKYESLMRKLNRRTKKIMTDIKTYCE